jgi:hypothetical protein
MTRFKVVDGGAQSQTQDWMASRQVVPIRDRVRRTTGSST